MAASCQISGLGCWVRGCFSVRVLGGVGGVMRVEMEKWVPLIQMRRAAGRVG